MASHDITAIVTELESLGVNFAALNRMASANRECVVHHSTGYDALGWSGYRFVERVLEQQRRSHTTTNPDAAPAPTAPLATPRQVDFIMSLLARRHRDGEDGGFFHGPTDRAGIASMTKADASTYITSLTNNY